MLCSRCKSNEATIHIKQNINGNKTELHLCSKCAGENGILSFAPFNFEGALSQLLSTGKEQAGERCPLCGSSFEDIRQAGKVGCANCYKLFSEQLRPSVISIQGSSRHRGRGLKPAPAKSEKDILKEQLAAAISEEKFEEAAKLRDRIAAMKEGAENE